MLSLRAARTPSSGNFRPTSDAQRKHGWGRRRTVVRRGGKEKERGKIQSSALKERVAPAPSQCLTAALSAPLTPSRCSALASCIVAHTSKQQVAAAAAAGTVWSPVVACQPHSLGSRPRVAHLGSAGWRAPSRDSAQASTAALASSEAMCALLTSGSSLAHVTRSDCAAQQPKARAHTHTIQ